MHPLLELLGETANTEARQEQERAVSALLERGWSSHDVSEALRVVSNVAGEYAIANHASSRPLLIVDDENPPAVHLRVPVSASAPIAAELSRRLRDKLASIKLLRPGISFGYAAVGARVRERRAA